MDVRITCESDLEHLKPPIWRAHGRTSFKLEVDGIPPDAAQYWEERLERYYTACGCETGSAFMLATLLSYIVVLGANGFGTLQWRDLGVGLALTTIAAIAGKIVGLLYARRHLTSTAADLASLIARLNQPKPEPG